MGGSRYLIAEWSYPDIGVVFAVCPSGGHDTVMLDYSRPAGDGEPTVAYIDEDRVPRTIATSFDDFVSGLRLSGASGGVSPNWRRPRFARYSG